MVIRIILCLLCITGMSVQGVFAQSNKALSEQLDVLSSKLLKHIDDSDAFVKRNKPLLGDLEIAALKEILVNHGYPKISEVGSERSHNYWKMVQQCDRDVEFQMNVLKQMGRAVELGEADKPEIYDLWEPENIESRRQEVNLETLELQKEKVNISNSSKPKRKNLRY